MSQETGRARPARAPRFRIGAVIAVALAAGFVAWLVLRNGGDHASPSTTPASTIESSRAVPVSPKGIETLAAALGHAIYWVGPKPGYIYELSQGSDGRIFVRYLPSGVKIGIDKPYLTVGTYPFPGAYAATQRAAAQPGAIPIGVGPAAIAFYNRSRPQSVFFAKAGSDYQVEVFDPSSARAHSLVASGRVDAVAGKAASQARVVSAKGLRTIASAAGHPLYWLGEKPGYTYELTQTATGAVFIRYLPPGVKVGADKPYLTVATYPFPGAFAAIEAVAKGKAMKLSGGGLAVVDAGYPKSVHLAYPSVDYQVEVFDPSPARARKAVASGQVQAVR